MPRSLTVAGLVAGVSAAALLAPTPGAQEASPVVPAERPRVGLVLCGGGARGTAHVGVIEVLEELHVPIDVIAGTSMGAIVGGMYASGLSIEEIEEELLAIDWKDVFRDDTPRRDLDFRRKQDDSSFLVDTKLGIRGGKLVLPAGVLQGQKLNLIFKKFLLPTIGIDAFDQLPIPFRAVAADINTGEAVVLDHGDLATAIRASMSIPGFLAPVRLDDHLLVDGGIADNLPIDVVLSMGADVVIAVDISTPLEDLERGASFLSVSSQVLTILMRRNVDERLALLDDDDVHLRPDLGDIGTSDFTRTEEAIAIGRDATRSMAGALSRLSLPPGRFDELRRRQSRADFTPPVIDAIRVETDAALSKSVISSRLRTRPGERLDADRLEEDLARVYGMDIFERVDFRLERKDEATELVVDARQKSWGPPYLRLGAFFTDDFDGSASYVLGTRVTYLPANGWGAEWRNELQLGDRIRVASEFFQPLGAGSPYFVAPRVEFAKQDIDIFSNGAKLAQIEISAFTAGLDVGRLLGNWGELRTGLFYVHGDLDVETGPPGFDPGKIDETRLTTGLLFDTLDDSSFPRVGVFGGAFLVAARESLGADENFETLSLSANDVFSIGPNTLIWGGEYGTALEEDIMASDQFAIGGFLNLSGLEQDSLRGNHRVLARIAGYRELGYEDRTPFGWPVYLGGSLEAGNVYDDRGDIDLGSLIFSGSVFLGLETFFGPIYLGYGMAEEGRRTAFLFVGGLPF